MNQEIITTIIGITWELYDEDILLEVNSIGEMFIGLETNPMNMQEEGEN
jgi:hypothetical protein